MLRRPTMEYVPDQSKEGMYDVFLSSDGKKFYVLEGLSINDPVISPPIQQFVHEHYAFFSVMYWIILGCTLTYLTGVFIVIPLMRRCGLY